MTNWPGNTPREPGWGDPDAATRAVPKYPRPGAESGNVPNTALPSAGNKPWAGQQSGAYVGQPQHPSVAADHQSGWPPPLPPQALAASAAGSGRNRQPLLLASAAVVLLVGGAVAYVRVSGVETGGTAQEESGQTAPPTVSPNASTVPTALPTTVPNPETSVAAQTAISYLEALSRGDAQKALSYSRKAPADTTLLTDEILGKQIAKWPISDIRIVEMKGDEKTSAKLYMTVSVKFGDKVHTDEISLSRNLQNGWWIDYVASEYKPGMDSRSYATLSVFGKQLRFGESFFAFPGYLEVTTSNQYIHVVSTDYPLFTSAPLLQPPAFDAELELNDAGTAAVTAALHDSFTKCETSNLIAPPGCPAALNVDDAVDGTLTWGRVNLEDTSTSFYDNLTVDVVTSGSIPVTYQSNGGQTVGTEQMLVVNEKFDIGSTPPQMID